MDIGIALQIVTVWITLNLPPTTGAWVLHSLEEVSTHEAVLDFETFSPAGHYQLLVVNGKVEGVGEVPPDGTVCQK